MPKRDEGYMNAQREAISRAALKVLLEKGVYATSLRDICKEAGVSMGGLYIHFRTREEAVSAACALDHADQLNLAPCSTWAEYFAQGFEDELSPGSRQSKRLRLTLQFAAELSQMTSNPEGLSHTYHLYSENISRNLSHLQSQNIITLPFGLDLTVMMHMQIFTGAVYQIASNKDLSPGSIREAAWRSLVVTAGLIE